ncbi:MAG: amidohydrolase [Thermaerobacterales bacterium]
MSRADLIFVRGQVVTVDPQDRVVSALAVRGDRIVYVGDDRGALAWKGSGTRVVDLEGRTLTPGLIDAHCHLVGEGSIDDTIDLKWPAVKSIAAIKVRVAEAARQQPPGTWIRGRGYNQNKLTEQRHPTRADLDPVAPEHPVILTRTCGHITACNTLALKAAGLALAEPDPQGGIFDRDSEGRLNGVCRETARERARVASAFTAGELRSHYRTACWSYVRQGVTSAHDMGRPVTTPDLMRWHMEDDLPLRVFAFVSNTVDDGLLPDEGGPLCFLQGGPMFRVGHYKLFADGSSSGPTAATREPYTVDPENCGILIYTQEEIDAMYRRANRLGWPTSAHAVGDRGIEMVLNGQERAMLDRPRGGVDLSPAYSVNPRHRIEHCAMAFPDLRARLRRSGVVPVAQAVFLYEFGDGYVRDYGPERGGLMMPCKSFLREGIPVAGSSDAPVTSSSVLLGLSTTCTRRSQSGQVIGREECLTPLEAIRIYTLHGAYAEFQEDVKGSLEVGKLADLTVFSQPLLDVNPVEWPDLDVDMTVVGGRLLHEL